MPAHPPASYTRGQVQDYAWLRLKALLGIFLCYSAYYLVRKDFVLVMPDLVNEGYTKKDLGMAMAAMAVSYGISNFVMGLLVDRFSVRWLMPGCLAISALVSVALAGATAVSCPLSLIMVLMACNGWVQGVGWPSSAKVLAHWFQHEERGRATSFWNLSNNLGAGLLGPLSLVALSLLVFWQGKLLLPAVLALMVAAGALFWLSDKPEDCGLPPLDDQKKAEGASEGTAEGTSEESGLLAGFARECLVIPELWLLSLLNICIYFIRYGVIDWVPLYMTEALHFDFTVASWAFTAFEFAAIPGTLLCGFLTDRMFRGSRVPVNLLSMSLVMLALVGYWRCGHEHWLMPVCMLATIGFLIYGCVALVHVQMIDIAPRRYVAACVGFCGLFGYLVGATGANLLLGIVIDARGWDGGFQLITAFGGVALVLLLALWYRDCNRPGPEPETDGRPVSGVPSADLQ